ncbi:hypothetical protein QQ045_006743 [Rhodiola kirilowii]
MDFLQFKDTEKPESSCKKRLTEDQTRILEANFAFNRKLDQDLKYHLSQQLNLPPRQITIWYQNKRARWKNQTMESDHKAIQLKLDNALSQTRKLEKEVQKLQKELDQARALLHGSPSIPYSSDGGSSFLDNELYACLAGPGYEAFGPSM